MEAQLISSPVFALRGLTHPCGETDKTQTDKEEQCNGEGASGKYYGEDRSRARRTEVREAQGALSFSAAGKTLSDEVAFWGGKSHLPAGSTALTSQHS